MKSIFLSHNHKDKEFVRRLASDLECHGMRIWIDEAELLVGDSMIEKIENGIGVVDYVAVILSPDSVESKWVQFEIKTAIKQNRYKILPILFKHCVLPSSLTTTIYADFTDSTKYIPSLKKLVESIGFVFNAKIFDTSITSLSDSISKAIHSNLPLAKKPFYRPFNYIGDTIEKASKEVEQKANEVGNIIVDTEEFRMLLEAEGNYISYVEVDIKQTAPWSLNQEFDSEPILGVFSINPSEYELARKQTHYHTYYDHKRKIKIDVSCSYEGGPLSIGFSSKWYGM